MRPLSILFWSALLLPPTVAGLIAWRTHDAMLAEARERVHHTALILREHATRVLEAQESVIDAIDARIADLDWDTIERSPDVHALLRSVAQRTPHVDGLWLVRPEGRTVNSADIFPMPRSIVTEREYFQVLKRQDVVHVGRMMRGLLKGNLNFNLSRRRTSQNGTFDGLILVTISLDYFESFWARVIGNEPEIVTLLREDGEYLARSPMVDPLPPRIRQDSPFFALSATSDSGVYENASLTDGADRIFGFAKLDGFPAHILVGTPRDAVASGWLRQTAGLFAAALAAMLALGSLVRLAQRREHRLSEEIAHRLRVESTLVAKEEHVAALEQAEAARRESEGRFRSLFETLTQGVVIHDADGRIVSANRAAEEILGVPAERMIGRSSTSPHWELCDGDGRPLSADDSPIELAMRSGALVRGLTVRIRNAETGDHRWLVVDAIPRFRTGEPRPSGVFALFSDVTERRRGEEAQRLLVREVDHRAKNALAVVQAVVRLSRGDTPEQFAQAVEGRVGALARAHTLLARSRWEGADLRTLVEDELAAFLGIPSRIAIAGPPVVLAADAAQPVGMVLHELSTNTAKYGALSVPDGRLRVSWTLEGGTGALTLRWEESGGPPVIPPSRSGFGTRLIRTSVESQLDGTVDYDWAAGGLRVTVIVPPVHMTSGRAAARASTAAEPSVSTDRLRHRRILVVEDNTPIALEMVKTLGDLGCVVVGPAGTVESAAKLAALETVDAAVLDVDLHGRSVLPVAELLEARGVPIVFCTGFGEIQGTDARWAAARILKKPVSPKTLAATLAGIAA